MSASIEALIANAQDFANQTVGNAYSEINFAIGALNGVQAIFAPKSVIVDPDEPAVFTPAIPPTMSPMTFDWSGAPGSAPEPAPIPDPLTGVGEMPMFSGQGAPSFTDPTKPSQLASFSSSPDSINSVDIPPAPAELSLSLGEVSLNDISVPTFGGFSPPALNVTKLGDAPAPSGDYAMAFAASYQAHAPAMYSALEGQLGAGMNRMNPQYQSQLSALQSKLNKYLAGGTALTSAVQDAIYERSKDKNSAEYRRTRDAGFTDLAKRGFTMPNGAMYSAMQQARQAAADNNARAATDIGVKIAEMEQANLQFAITQTQALTATTLSAMISYHQVLVSVNGQALDAAKSVLSALIEVYNAQVKGYEASIDRYKAEVGIFDAQMRAAMASIEVYKAQMAGLEAEANVDRAKVDAYRSKAEALNAVAGAYRATIDGVVAKASVEKLKIEVFGARVQAYAALTQAKSSEWQAYAAAVGGEEAKAKVYAEQVHAYGEQVSAWRAKVEGKSAQVQAISISNQGRSEVFKEQVMAYEAKVRANATMTSAKTEYEKTLINAYSVANQAAVSVAQMQADLYRNKTQVAMERGRLENTTLIENAKISLGKAQAISQATTSMAGTLGQLASAAMSGMNTLVAQTVQE